MGWQVVEIIDELVEVAMKTRYESFWLHADENCPHHLQRKPTS
jgi:hypothetical protein